MFIYAPFMNVRIIYKNEFIYSFLERCEWLRVQNILNFKRFYFENILLSIVRVQVGRKEWDWQTGRMRIGKRALFIQCGTINFVGRTDVRILLCFCVPFFSDPLFATLICSTLEKMYRLHPDQRVYLLNELKNAQQENEGETKIAVTDS